ncbi:MAG TPA: prolyl oligopeptidase family serine peptidase [Actinomycetes bacterium]|nr:prolyl oligopeptidase family serine peptidase [Actinomycetes bacterium]
MSQAESFPRQAARTQKFTLGAPRAFTIAPDGSRVAFLRSRAGDDRTTCLWVLDLDAEVTAERLVADPNVLLSGGDEELSAEERARRERTRTGAAGIVQYATDKTVATAAFALSSRLFVTDLAAGRTRELPAVTPAIDPRPDPTGTRVAYVCAGTLRIAEIDGSADRPLAEPDGPAITWGLAEFVAQEEMDRTRGYWWAPDGQRLLVARVDEAPVQRWYIADPANPGREPAEVAYPAAGTPNAVVSLALVDLDGSRQDVRWDDGSYPYLVAAQWSASGPPLLLVMSRDQRHSQILMVDVDSGLTTTLDSAGDARWLEVVPGVPDWTGDGRLVTTRDSDDERRLVVDGEPITTGLQVRAVLDVAEDSVLFVASAAEPTQVDVYRAELNGEPVVERVSEGAGVHAAARGGPVTVLSSASLEWFGARVRVLLDGKGEVADIQSHAETPSLTPSVAIRAVGARALRTALLFPTGHQRGTRKLPVLVAPYAGPHHQEVVYSRNAYLTDQWLADQGFAIVIADGRGTPGRGPAWDREIAFNVADPVLEDQVDALLGVAADEPDVDLARVGILGWSFGGYLAALAVLRRPDIFHAAVAGAPVTDWSLYDTFYTERYLGTPDAQPEAYKRTSIVDDAPRLERPLMIIHGLADDNVVAAHTLRFSSALLAAGRPHTVLPLSGVTHMTPQEVVAENLLLLQVRFLKEALGVV